MFTSCLMVFVLVFSAAEAKLSFLGESMDSFDNSAEQIRRGYMKKMTAAFSRLANDPPAADKNHDLAQRQAAEKKPDQAETKSMKTSIAQIKAPAVNNKKISHVTDAYIWKDNTASQLSACVQAFAPFPERGADLRNRFIVDLAYEMGCEHNAENVEHCEDKVPSLQKMSNAELNAKCSSADTFPDMCGGCLVHKQLRDSDECGLLTQTERKDTVIRELQNFESATSTPTQAAAFQSMSPEGLIASCATAEFTDWCDVLTSCGAPVQNCTQFSQQDKKNTYIAMLLKSDELQKVRERYPFWNTDGTEAKLQGETDADLKSKCAAGAMSLLASSDIERITKQVEMQREQRKVSLRERRDALLQVGSN